MKKLLLATAVAALPMALPSAALAQRSPAAVIVVVSGARIYSECTACRAAQQQLQTMLQQGQTRAQQLGQPLQTEQQSIEQAAAALDKLPAGPAKTQQQAALQTRFNTFQQNQTRAQQELARLDQNLQSTRANVAQQINTRLNPIYTQVMNAHGANLLLDTDATLAHAPALDVTAEVLTALNAALPSVSVTPLPAAPAQQQPQGR
jgi:outer membrane protein